MKIPEYVKNAIRKSGKHNKIAVENNLIVRKWLEARIKNNAEWEDVLIDSLELGNDSSDFLIEFLENSYNESKKI